MSRILSPSMGWFALPEPLLCDLIWQPRIGLAVRGNSDLEAIAAHIFRTG
jgi:hypothetical protein